MSPSTSNFTLVQDFGTVSTDVVGVASLAVTPLTLSVGTIYFYAISCDENGGAVTIGTTGTVALPYAYSSSANASAYYCYLVSAASDPLPASITYASVTERTAIQDAPIMLYT